MFASLFPRLYSLSNFLHCPVWLYRRACPTVSVGELSILFSIKLLLNSNLCLGNLKAKWCRKAITHFSIYQQMNLMTGKQLGIQSWKICFVSKIEAVYSSALEMAPSSGTDFSQSILFTTRCHRILLERKTFWPMRPKGFWSNFNPIEHRNLQYIQSGTS